jgi:hypothetical protein
VLNRRSSKNSRRVSRLESAIAAVPRSLDGRAFIARNASLLLPVQLDLTEWSQVESMISRAYLESYIREFGASVLIDTPLGLLDCGLPSLDEEGHARTISYRRLTAFFGALELRPYVEQLLDFEELCDLREQFHFRWLLGQATAFALGAGEALQSALVRARYLPPQAGLRSDVSAVDEVTGRVFRLLDAVERFLPDDLLLLKD